MTEDACTHRPNLWPDQELLELRPAFRALGQLIISTGQLLARHCDAYVASRNNVRLPARLQDVIRDSLCPKVRSNPTT